MSSAKKQEPPAPFQAFGVEWSFDEKPALVSGVATPRKGTAKIGPPLWRAYGYRSNEPIENLARTPREAWERALHQRDAAIAHLEKRLAEAQEGRQLALRELDKVVQAEAEAEKD